MSWWNPFDWAKWLSNKFSYAFDKLGDGLGVAFEQVGLDFVGDGADWLSDKVGQKIKGSIDRAVSYVKSLPSNVERSFDDLFSEQIYTDFGKWFGTNLLNSAELAGIPEILETAADIIKFNTRTLTAREKEVAKSVFGDTIRLDLVRLDQYSFAGLINGDHAYTTFHTINSWGSISDATLIHELTHVWQFEEYGADYIVRAIEAQASDAGYNYGGVSELLNRMSQGQGLSSFNYEQQGQILQDYYSLIESGNNTGVYSQDLAIYAYYVQQVSSLSQSQLNPLTPGTGNDLIVGNQFSNYLAGDGGDDRLYGGDGDDNLIGGEGNDNLVGGSGNDNLVGGNGYDSATYNEQYTNYNVSFTSSGDIQITGNEGTDNLWGIEQINFAGYGVYKVYTGDGGNNSLTADPYYWSFLYGGEGNDSLTGSNYNDTLYGGNGNDTLIGGTGYDFAIYNQQYTNYNVSFTSNGDIQITGGEGTDLLKGIEQINFAGYGVAKVYNGDGGNNNLTADPYYWSFLYGGDGNDSLTSGYGDDILNGGAGDDYLNGGSGANKMSGGSGNDAYIVGSTDVITEYASQGTDIVYSTNSYILGANLENLVLDGTAAINGTGNNLNNVINGNTANNSISGGDGNDTLNGEAGNDYLNGGDGADKMSGGSGNDSYIVDNAADVVIENTSEGIDTVVTAKTYTLGANVENLTLTDSAVINGTGNDLNNYILGNAAANNIDAKGGDDQINGRGGNDVINGGAGNDTLLGDAGNDALNGSTGNDVLYGNDGIDTLLGGDGNDALYGGNGNDFLTGGNGKDTLWGGVGADRFRFNSKSEGMDIIKDFQRTEGDKIEIIKSSFGASSFNQFSYNSSTGGLFFDASPSDNVGAIQLGTIENKPAGFLTQLDIVLV